MRIYPRAGTTLRSGIDTMRNRSARNAFLNSKSWKGEGNHKKNGKRRVSKLRRLGARHEISTLSREV